MKFRIMGKYHAQRAEEIDRASSRKEAYQLLTEYMLAYGPGWSLWVK